MEYVLAAARAIDEMKAEDIIVLHIGEVSGFADYFIIASCQTRTQMRAAVEKVRELGKAFGRRALGLEGEGSKTWMLLDCVDVIVHLFHPESRRYYDLERLWGDANPVEWRQAATAQLAGE